MRLRVLIVDDEKLARSRMRRLLGTYEDMEICGEAENGREALTRIQEQSPDLIFLDIRMPLLTGFEVLAELDRAPCIVFTTAFNEYALQAFEVNALDYLLKPISKDKLDRALEKARRLVGASSTALPDIKKLLSSIESRENQLRRFSSRTGDKVTLIPSTQVCYFRAEDKYTFLYAPEEKCIVPYTLRELEQRLDPLHFLRVHRSAIINLDRVQSVEKWFGGKWKVLFENGDSVLVSANYAAEFKRRIGL